MKEQEAIKELEHHIKFLDDNWKPHPDYKVLDALNVCIKAAEKQIPEKVIYYSSCPNCLSIVFDEHNPKWQKEIFCWNCGKKVYR